MQEISCIESIAQRHTAHLLRYFCKLLSLMPIDPTKTVQIRITAPKPIAE